MLKKYIQSTEERVLSYKNLIEDVARNRTIFSPIDEFVIKFKEHIREMKNYEERMLKKYREEKTFENQGLNPPWCYKY